MRVLNDKEREDRKQEQPPLDFLTVLVHTIYAALGFGCAGSALTVFFVPLPMIASHLKLSEPWPKITAILGAVVALVFFGMPGELVSLIFVLGVFVGEGVKSRKAFWKLASQAVGVSAGVTLVFLFWNAQLQGLSLLGYWSSMVEQLMENYGKVEFLSGLISPELLKQTILYEGPFIFLSGLLLCLWISIGFASHLVWFPEKHPLHATNLRKLRLPSFAGVAFVVFFAARYLAQMPERLWLEGVFLVISSVMLIQGCIYLSVLLARRRLAKPAKVLVYSFSLTFGSYAMIGLGLLGPFFIDRALQKKLEEKR